MLFLLLTCLMFVPVTFGQDGIRILKNIHSLDQVYRGHGSIEPVFNGPPVDFKDMTICIRFFFKVIRRDLIVHMKKNDVNVLYLYADNPSWLEFGYPQRKGSQISFLVDERDSGFADIYDTNMWMHQCISFDNAKGELLFVMNGKVVNVFGGFSDVEIPGDILDYTTIGRQQDNTLMCPEGEFTDFNVWNKAMSAQELEDWTSCRQMSKGNVVDWTKLELQTANVTEYFLQRPEELCEPRRPGNVVFPLRRNFTRFLSVCHQFQGSPLVVQDARTQPELKEEALKYSTCRMIPGSNNPATEAVWIGYWDSPSEGNYTNVNTGNQLGTGLDSYTNWDVIGEPNGGTIENCASLAFGRNMWNDMPCDYELCFYCKLETYPFFVMRGLCHKSKFDYQYSWKIAATNESDFYSFRGYKDTELFYDVKRSQWVLQTYSNTSIYALSNSTDYPIGTTEWEVHGDPCYDDPVTKVTVNFNACQNLEYNCRDGTCIDINKRCDRRVDCADNSDEIDCEIVKTDSSYLKEVSPPPVDNKPKSGVTIGIEVQSILEINEVDFLISLQLRVSLTWLDKRLTMLDLRNDSSVNTLTEDFKRMIWLPQVVFYNTKDKEESLNDDKAHATISRQGNFQLSTFADLHNNHIYKGSENPLTIQRVYSQDFICEFNMRAYPFDTQKCSAIFIMKGSLGNFVDLLPGKVEYLGPIDLTQYFVKEIKISSHAVPPNTDAVKVDIVFSRRIFATLLTTYVPTALLCIVCFSTNHFEPFFFEAIVTVNLTSLLVLTTLFISVSNSLPATAYIKMVDAWLLFTLVIPFTEVILHTYMDNLRLATSSSHRSINQHGHIRTVKRANKVSNGGLVGLDDPDIKMSNGNDRQAYADKAVVKRLRIVSKITTIGIPLGFSAFSIIYIIVGLML